MPARKPGGILCYLKGTALFEKNPHLLEEMGCLGPLEKEEVEQQLWDGCLLHCRERHKPGSS